MGKKDPDDMTFLAHLDAFRKHLIRSVVAVLFFSVLAFIFKGFVFDEIIFAPRESSFFTNRAFCKLAEIFDISSLCINQKPIALLNVDLGGLFNMHILVSIVTGFILAFPYIIYEFWKFIKPALQTNEKKHSAGVIIYTSILFIMGVLFGYYLIVPLTLEFLGNYQLSDQILNQINIKSYISSVTTVCLSTGLIFEFPIIVYFLSKIGILTPTFLKKYRRHSIVVIFIIAAIITPPDIMSQIMVALPIIFLYEISIKISANVIKRKTRKQL